MLTVLIGGKKLTNAQVLYLRRLLLGVFNACSETINNDLADDEESAAREFRAITYALIRVLENEISAHSCKDNVILECDLIITINSVRLSALYGAVVKLALGQSRTIRNKAARGLPAREIDHMDGLIKRLL